MVDNLQLLGAGFGSEVCNKLRDFIVAERLCVEIDPLRVQPLEVGEVVFNVLHHLFEQRFFRLPPPWIRFVLIVSQSLLAATAREERTDGDERFLLEIVIADRNRSAEIVQSDQIFDLCWRFAVSEG